MLGRVCNCALYNVQYMESHRGSLSIQWIQNILIAGLHKPAHHFNYFGKNKYVISFSYPQFSLAKDVPGEWTVLLRNSGFCNGYIIKLCFFLNTEMCHILVFLFNSCSKGKRWKYSNKKFKVFFSCSQTYWKICFDGKVFLKSNIRFVMQPLLNPPLCICTDCASISW